MSSFSNEETEAQRQYVALCPPRGTRQVKSPRQGLYSPRRAPPTAALGAAPSESHAPLWPDGPAQTQDEALRLWVPTLQQGTVPAGSTWSPTVLVPEQPHMAVPALSQPTFQAHGQANLIYFPASV